MKMVGSTTYDLQKKRTLQCGVGACEILRTEFY
jgi:hypothetical protein